MENQKLLTVKEVCDEAGLGVSTFRKIRRENPDKFPPVKREKNQPFFEAETVERLKKFLDSKCAKPVAKNADSAACEPPECVESGQGYPNPAPTKKETNLAAVDVSIVPTPNLFPSVGDDGTLTIEQRVDRIRGLVEVKDRIDAAYVFAVGRELLALKKQAGHGHFEELLAKNGWSTRRAQEYMQISKRFGKTQAAARLGKSQLSELLALPQGDEQNFFEAQEKSGTPAENLSARELRKRIHAWVQKEIPGEYFGISAEKDLVVEELNAKPVDEKETNSTDAPDKADSPNVPPPTTDATKKNLPPIAHCQNGSCEWYTPPDVIEAARAVLGVIDLDPASTPLANETVKATKFFTAEDDGLKHGWTGRVWLNPPFANGLIEKFAKKIVEGYSSGKITSAIVLVDNATETQWFRLIVDNADAIVFTTGRIKFLLNGTDNHGSGHTRGQAFLYFGQDIKNFFAGFSRFGWCCRPQTGGETC